MTVPRSPVGPPWTTDEQVENLAQRIAVGEKVAFIAGRSTGKSLFMRRVSERVEEIRSNK